MNSGIGRIIVGILFVVLGAFRLSSSRSDGIKIFGFVMLAYGLFTIGHGIYKISKGESGRLSNKSKNDDDTLDSDLE